MPDKRVNIYLKDNIHTEAKIVSVLRKKTLNAFLEEIITDAVQRDERLVKDLLK